jgi:hypothetical protein
VSRLLRGLLVLCVTGGGLAAASPDARGLVPRGLVQSLSSPSVSGWALSDFDGDSKIDLATTGPGRGDGRGYSHEVRLNLSASRETSFTFRSRSARIQLSAWDVDGDNDRDIVILESSTLEPIGVWLNDGFGNFAEGDLADFKDALQRNGRAFEFRAPRFRMLPALREQRVQADVLRNSIMRPDVSSEAPASEGRQAVQNFHRSDARPRAPPRNS